jgi:serine/threonine-protein kinase
VAPISLIDRHLCLAMRDPRDIAVIDKLRFASGMSQVIGVFATELAIRRGIGKLYHGEDPQQQDIGEWRGQGWDKSAEVEAPAPFSDRYTGTRERQFDTGDLEKRMRAEIGSAEPVVPASGAQRTLAMQVLPKIGATFAGRYRLEALIGEGGSATIFKAIDTELNEPVALKLFRPSTPAEAENLVARFKLELSLSRLLSHPNIIRLFDLGSHEGWRYLTMELLEGRDLALMLGEHAEPLGLRSGLRILEQVCVGLQFAHEQGVVHRDIKPQNLFITHDGIAKLMDFGIAKKLRSAGVTVAGMVAGTPEFISPEQIKSFSSVTHLTDLYALGATAYMMFTGAPPFTHPELIGLLMAQANDRPPPLRSKNPEIPLDLEAAILKLLEKDPARRFQSARAFGVALRAIRERLEAADE